MNFIQNIKEYFKPFPAKLGMLFLKYILCIGKKTMERFVFLFFYKNFKFFYSCWNNPNTSFIYIFFLYIKKIKSQLKSQFSEYLFFTMIFLLHKD